jgi:hypothetical protein
MTPAARTAELVRLNAEARWFAAWSREVLAFVSDLNAEHRLDTAIRNAEQAIARKRAAEPKEGQRP